jgi:hypothetical protein
MISTAAAVAAAAAAGARGSGIKRGSCNKLQLSTVSGDVTKLLSHKPARLSTFQAASQFNCLEMVAPSVTPEHGITGYASDKTQGPACSVSAGPATAFRNYFLQMPDGSMGQTESNQVENAGDLLAALGNNRNNAGAGSGDAGAAAGDAPGSLSVCGGSVGGDGGKFMSVCNGYTLASDAQLRALNDAAIGPLGDASLLSESHPGRRDDLKCLLRVGAQTDTVVTSSCWGTKPALTPDSGPSAHTVTQVFGSAPAVTYSGNMRSAWKPFASLVLEASYESTLLIGLEAMLRHNCTEGSNTVYLTLLGGGVFGNEIEWIAAAIEDACKSCADEPLDVKIVCYGGHVEHEISDMIKRFEDFQG